MTLDRRDLLRGLPGLALAIALPANIRTARAVAADARRVPLQLGVFSGGFSPQKAEAFEAWAGRRSAYNVEFLSQVAFTGKDSIANSARWVVGVWLKAQRPDRNMMFSVPLATNQDKSLANVAAGNYDKTYEDAARAIANGYPKAIIRPGWEFNGDWYPWAAKGRTADYIGAFRRVTAIFRSASRDFTMDWCPNLGPNQFPAEQAYPGDDVVDVIGLDGYDNNWLKIEDPVARWPKFRDQDHGLTWHANFAAAHGKPMSYPEWATGKDAGDNPHFIQQMYEWITSHNVAYASYWDSNAAFKGQLSNNQYPAASDAYLKTFARYSGH